MNATTIFNNFSKGLGESKFPGLRIMIIGDESKATLGKMESLKGALAQSGASVWAMSDLLGGVEREPFIQQGCSEATLVFVLITEQIDQQGDHQKFIKKAMSEKSGRPFGDIYIIPVIVEDVDVPYYIKELSPVDAKSVKSIESLITILSAKSKSQKKITGKTVISW